MWKKTKFPITTWNWLIMLGFVLIKDMNTELNEKCSVCAHQTSKNLKNSWTNFVLCLPVNTIIRAEVRDAIVKEIEKQRTEERIKILTWEQKIKKDKDERE